MNDNNTFPWPETIGNPTIKLIKRITKTIERFDTEGNSIGKEVIVEEHEDVQQEVWDSPYQTPWVWDGTSNPNYYSDKLTGTGTSCNVSVDNDGTSCNVSVDNDGIVNWNNPNCDGGSDDGNFCIN